MTYVVTDNCVNCKYTDCVQVCPVDCFYEGANFVVINPDECIDCGLCEPECPAGAILNANDLDAQQVKYVEVNREYSLKWECITEPKEPMDGHEDWLDVEDKFQHLILE